MAEATIDKLSIQVTADTEKAVKKLQGLQSMLRSLQKIQLNIDGTIKNLKTISQQIDVQAQNQIAQAKVQKAQAEAAQAQSKAAEAAAKAQIVQNKAAEAAEKNLAKQTKAQLEKAQSAADAERQKHNEAYLAELREECKRLDEIEAASSRIVRRHDSSPDGTGVGYGKMDYALGAGASAFIKEHDKIIDTMNAEAKAAGKTEVQIKKLQTTITRTAISAGTAAKSSAESATDAIVSEIKAVKQAEDAAKKLEWYNSRFPSVNGATTYDRITLDNPEFLKGIGAAISAGSLKDADFERGSGVKYRTGGIFTTAGNADLNKALEEFNPDAIDDDWKEYAQTMQNVGDVLDALNQKTQDASQSTGFFDSIIQRITSTANTARDILNGMLSGSSIFSNYTNLGGAFDFSGLTDMASQAAQSIQNFFVDAFTRVHIVILDTIKIFSTIGHAIGTTFNAVKGVVSGIVNAFKSVGKVISGIVNTITKAVSTIVKTISGAVQSIWKVLTGIVSTVAGTIKNAVSSMSGSLLSMLSSITGIHNAAELLGATFSSLVAPVTELGNTLVDFADTAIGALQRFVNMGITRILRTAISQIGQDFTEAFENVYHYSEQINSSFYSAMDSIATSFNTLASSLAALAAEVIEVFEPVITYLIDGFTEVVNTVNQFIAALTGKSTWTKATVVPTKYIADETEAAADAAESASDAAKSVSDSTGSAASSVKKTADATKDAEEAAKGLLADWDELNIIQQDAADAADAASGSTPSTSSGSSKPKTSSKDKDADEEEEGTDYTTMFSEVPVESWIGDIGQTIMDYIKSGEFFQLGEYLSDLLLNALNSIPIYSIMSKVAEICNDIVDVIRGFFANPETWQGIGQWLAEGFNGIIQKVDWQGIGDMLAKKTRALFDIILGFFGIASDGSDTGEGIDWKATGEAFNGLFTGLFDGLKEEFEQYEFKDIGTTLSTKLQELWDGVDFDGLAQSFFGFLGAALGNAINFGEGLLTPVITKINEAINQDEDHSLSGALSTLIFGNLDAGGADPGLISNMIGWVKTNVFDPFLLELSSRIGSEDTENLFDFSNIVSLIFTALGLALVAGAKTIETFVAPVWNAVSRYFSSYIESNGGLFQGILAGLGDFGSDFTKVFESAMGLGGDARNSYLDEILNEDFQTGAGNKFAAWVLKNIINPVDDAFNGAFGTKPFQTLYENLTDENGWPSKLMTWVTEQLTPVATTLGEEFDKLSSTFSTDPVGTLKTALEDFGGWLKDTFWTTYIQPFIDKTALPALKTLVDSFTEYLSRQVEAISLDFSMRSKYFAEANAANLVHSATGMDTYSSILDYVKTAHPDEYEEYQKKRASILEGNNTASVDSITAQTQESIVNASGDTSISTAGGVVPISDAGNAAVTATNVEETVTGTFSMTEPTISLPNGYVTFEDAPMVTFKDLTGIDADAASIQATTDSAILSGNYDIYMTDTGMHIPTATGLYASGGFPTEGEMFIAREAGPEMVGTIGNHSAVANNGDIVEGIASGVESANRNQEALLRQGISVLQQLLAKNSTVTVTPSAAWGKMQAQSARMYGRVTG